MFTDECKFDLGAYTRDWIRLDSESQKKLKNGDLNVYDLINRTTRKFEPCVMVAGVYLIMASVISFSLKEP